MCIRDSTMALSLARLLQAAPAKWVLSRLRAAAVAAIAEACSGFGSTVKLRSNCGRIALIDLNVSPS